MNVGRVKGRWRVLRWCGRRRGARLRLVDEKTGHFAGSPAHPMLPGRKQVARLQCLPRGGHAAQSVDSPLPCRHCRPLGPVERPAVRWIAVLEQLYRRPLRRHRCACAGKHLWDVEQRHKALLFVSQFVQLLHHLALQCRLFFHHTCSGE